MHIAICRLLEPFGYYKFDYEDEEGWPHYNILEHLPPLKAGEQTVLMKEAIVQYFWKKNSLSKLIVALCKAYFQISSRCFLNSQTILAPSIKRPLPVVFP